MACVWHYFWQHGSSPLTSMHTHVQTTLIKYIVSVITCVHVFMAKVHLRTPQQPSFYHYNLTKKGPNGKIRAPNRSSSDDAAIGVQKVLLQFLYLVAVLEMAYF